MKHLKHLGRFSCIARFQGAKITLYSHFDYEYVLGHKIAFLCIARGNPRPHITWYKDGAEIFSHLYMHVSGNWFLCAEVNNEVFIGSWMVHQRWHGEVKDRNWSSNADGCWNLWMHRWQPVQCGSKEFQDRFLNRLRLTFQRQACVDRVELQTCPFGRKLRGTYFNLYQYFLASS